MVDFRLELVTPRRRRAIALGAGAAALLVVSAVAWLWPQLPKAYPVPPPGPVQVLAAQFDSAQAGWVALRSGVGPQAPSGIYRTEDGGRTWQPLPVPVRTPSAASLRFFDARQGVIELTRDESDGRTALYGTDDAGGSWEARSLPRSRNGQVTLYFADPLHGFEVFRPAGSTATLVSRTADGGRTWQDPALDGLPALRAGLGFIDARSGLAVSGGTIYRTADAGDSWTAVTTPPELANPRAVAPPIAVGGTVLFPIDRWLAVSNDGGLTFPVLRPALFDLADAGVSCYDAGHCRAAQGLDYMVTDDGGVTWRPRVPLLPKGESLGPVHAVDARTAWSVVAAAQGQQLLMTRDDGATWRPVPLPRL